MSLPISVFEKPIHGYSQSTNGTYNFPTTSRGSFDWPGGQGTFSVAGSIGVSTTIALQMLGPDNTTWFNVGVDTTKTASGAGNFALPPCQLRVQVIIGAPATNIHASVGRVLL